MFIFATVILPEQISAHHINTVSMGSEKGITSPRTGVKCGYEMGHVGPGS